MTRIRFEDLPSTNTPRNAENLNKLNNVVISPNEPTTGEEVWIQKGKNLIKDASYGHINVNTGITDTDTSWFHSKLINVKDNAPYTFSLSTTDTYQQWIWVYYKEDDTFISAEYGNIETGNSIITKIIPSNCNKVRVAWRANLNYSNVQLEQGETATDYEPYIEKKIYTKNDNGVYKEFYNKTKLQNYSTTKQIIGNWIDSKPIYRKTILQNTFTAGESEINHNISDVERIVNISGIAYRTDGSAEPLPTTLCPPEFIKLWQLSVYDVDRTRYRIYVGSNLITDYARLSELYLTLEYTKTTD